MQGSTFQVLVQAVRYAEMGYRVVPVYPGTKRPHAGLAPRGVLDASSDEALIAAWWRSCSDCGVALVPPQDVLVLDVDTPEAWDDLSGMVGEAPRARTPSGGRHVWFRVEPAKASLLKARVRALPGVDLRGLGRTALVAPPTPGYFWEVELLPVNALPRLPEAVWRRLAPKKPRSKRVVQVVDAVPPARLEGLLRWAVRRVAEAQVGTRHDTLLRTARLLGGYAHMGLDPEVVVEALVEAGVRAGLPVSEAEATAWDGFNHGTRAPIGHLDLTVALREARNRRLRRGQP